MTRLFTVLGLVASLGLCVSMATAKPPPTEPRAPKQIDQTPPLVPIPNAHVSDQGLLVGGQPTLQQLELIQQAGYLTVISLRTDRESGDEGEKERVERLGMKFVSIPVPGPEGLTEANARAISRALDERDALPAVVHCLTGQRSAALLGLEVFVVDRKPPAVEDTSGATAWRATGPPWSRPGLASSELLQNIP